MLRGFVDLQINGYLGVDFSNSNLTEEGCIKAFDGILSTGTSLFLPTIITSPLDVYKKNIKIITKIIKVEMYKKHVPGIHLEGPFFADSAAIGAHNPEYTKSFSKKLLDEFIELSENKIKLLTIGADIDGAPELVRYAKTKGTVVSLGHHMADEEQVKLATDAGASTLTHLGNGIPNLINRHYNPIWSGLAEDRLTAMLITDGHHLPSHLIKTIKKVKGLDKIIVVSDAAPLAGLPPGKYETLGNKAILEESGKLHNPDKQCLVGSSAMLIDCANFLYKNKIFTYEEIIKVCIENPLKLLDIKIEEQPQTHSGLKFDKLNGFYCQKEFHSLKFNLFTNNFAKLREALCELRGKY